MKIYLNELFPVRVLWPYREFQRDQIEAPRLSMVPAYTLEEITRYVKEHGIAPLELSVIQDRALLTDGNHRIVAARSLDIKFVAVNVIFFGDDAGDTFYDHTLDRFLPIGYPLQYYLSKIYVQDPGTDVMFKDDVKLPWV